MAPSGGVVTGSIPVRGSMFAHGGLAQVVERSIRIRQVGGSMPPTSSVVFSFVWPNWRNGSAPAYGAGGCGFDPHVGLWSFSFGSRSSVGRSSASHAEGPGFDPLRELLGSLISRKVERSIRPENFGLASFSDMV
jgi:hypothetical protein